MLMTMIQLQTLQITRLADLVQLGLALYHGHDHELM
jgi:hypothetical protein